MKSKTKRIRLNFHTIERIVREHEKQIARKDEEIAKLKSQLSALLFFAPHGGQ